MNVNLPPPALAHAHRPQRPSPLAKVHFTRPISMDPTMGLVRDPKFWKRFSAAVHMTEAQTAQMAKTESGGGSLKSTSTIDIKEEKSWLAQQRQERRRCRVVSALITVAIVMLIAGALVAYLWFTQWRST